VPKEILELPNDSAVGFVYANQANGLLLIHSEFNQRGSAVIPDFTP
jgi:hypothetical protein